MSFSLPLQDSVQVLVESIKKKDSQTLKDPSVTQKMSFHTDIVESIVGVMKEYYLKTVSSRQIFRSMMKGLFHSLDPYSSYINEEEYKIFLKGQKGIFVGVGLELINQNNFHVVVSCLLNSPSERAGVQTGDRLIRVDGVSVLELSLSTVVSLIKGFPGSSVQLTFLRNGLEKDFYLQRCFIKDKAIIDVCVIDNSVGYLKITSFKKGVFKQFCEIFQKLSTKQLKGLILDLRNNSGGVLNEALKLVSLFIKPKKLIVTLENKNMKKQYISHSKNVIKNLPLCLLINQGTASGAEVLAGSFQDHKRATIIGEKSFGKGSVQTVIPVPVEEGGALCLTTHSYILPGGDSVEGKGIFPDIFIGNSSMKDFFVISHRKKRKNNAEDLLLISSKTIRDQQLLAAIKDLQP